MSTRDRTPTSTTSTSSTWSARMTETSITDAHDTESGATDLVDLRDRCARELVHVERVAIGERDDLPRGPTDRPDTPDPSTEGFDAGRS